MVSARRTEITRGILYPRMRSKRDCLIQLACRYLLHDTYKSRFKKFWLLNGVSYSSSYKLTVVSRNGFTSNKLHLTELFHRWLWNHEKVRDSIWLCTVKLESGIFSNLTCHTSVVQTYIIYVLVCLFHTRMVHISGATGIF